MGISNADALVSEKHIKSKLFENGKKAIATGVFGVPICRIDNELFWGDDTLDMITFYINNPKMFDSK